jgi:hypothetical protein
MCYIDAITLHFGKKKKKKNCVLILILIYRRIPCAKLLIVKRRFRYMLALPGTVVH